MESAQRSRVPSSSPDSAVSSDGAAEDEVAGGSGGGGTNDDDEQRERVLREHRLAAHAEAATARYVGAPSRSTVAGGEKLFDPASQRIKDDVLRMVIQYLQNEGFVASVMTIQDEANVKTKEKLNRRAIFKRMRQSIVEGDWSEVEKLCSRSALKGYKSLLYAIYKQQYLELVDRQEYQKAFTLLSRRLKPLENMQATQHEFKDLCYLLTCKSIQDAPSCKDWEGVMASREKLIEQFHTVLFELEGEPAFPDARGVLCVRSCDNHRVHPPCLPACLPASISWWRCG
jgi:COMPASS component SWD3